MLLRPSSALRSLGDDQLGAGVYVEIDGVRHLLGLISGQLRLEADGGDREFLTVMGPRELWRAVTHHRNSERPRRRALREDVL